MKEEKVKTKENKRKIFKKISIILAIVLILLLVGYLIYLFAFQEKLELEEEKDSFENIARVLEEQPSEKQLEERKQYVEDLKASGNDIVENTLIEDHYASIHLKTESGEETYQLGYTGELNIRMLVETIGYMFSSNIQVNQIQIGEKNSIKIDLSSKKAPFQTDEYVDSDYKKYFIEDKAELAKCLFDSIKETIKANFGQEKDVYYSVDGQDITIEGLPTIKANQAY